MFRKIRATFFLAIAAFLVLLPAAWAQSTSAIQGTVLDSSGAVVANAQVTVQNQGTSELRTTQTDSNGRYAVPSLPVGTYKITVKNAGMQTAVANNLLLEVARTAVQDFRLKIASVETVGPTLGLDSIQKSAIAAAIGLSIVMIFMLLYYRLPGFLVPLAIIDVSWYITSKFA